MAFKVDGAVHQVVARFNMNDAASSVSACRGCTGLKEGATIALGRALGTAESSDAVRAVYALHDQVNVLRKQKGLKRIGRYARKDGKVTPAIVYINAGLALDGLAQISQRIDSTRNYGDLYEAPNLSGKTPSDVFAIMNLSSRILAALSAKPGSALVN